MVKTTHETFRYVSLHFRRTYIPCLCEEFLPWGQTVTCFHMMRAPVASCGSRIFISLHRQRWCHTLTTTSNLPKNDKWLTQAEAKQWSNTPIWDSGRAAAGGVWLPLIQESGNLAKTTSLVQHCLRTRFRKYSQEVA